MEELRIEYLPVDALKPYSRNAKKHPDEQVEHIANSIREFGFRQPLVIDRDGVLVIGHGRLLAANKLGLKTVPCVRADDLTDEQVKALRLADNKTNESGWDFAALEEELDELEAEFDMSEFGFEELEKAANNPSEWFEREDREYDSTEGEDEEYAEFVDKFKPKKTTDDCYTPENIYGIIADWVEKEYGVERSRFVRPFYPGGDYQKEKYPDGCAVVDNPPFSILAEIIRWYMENGIRFFLFAPTLTLFAARGMDVCYLPCYAPITYENGATVQTSFITNMDEYRIRTAPDLCAEINTANDENLKQMHKELPKYSYPDEVVTAIMAGRWARYGVDFRVMPDECYRISELDAQKEMGKAVFGGGYLLGKRAAAERAAAERAAAERAAAERAAAHKWELSDREREICASLA